MLLGVYLRKGVVYLPTLSKTVDGIYKIGEPVAVVSVSETGRLKQALLDTASRGNPRVPNPPRDAQQIFILPKYAGVKSMAAFYQSLQIWDISDYDNIYRIVGQRPRRDRGWEDDPDNVVTFPPDTKLDEVIDRAIDILQKASTAP